MSMGKSNAEEEEAYGYMRYIDPPDNPRSLK